MRRRPFVLSAFMAAASAAFPLALAASSGCGGVGTSSASTTGGDAGPEPVTVTLHPGAAPLEGQSECTVVITTGISINAAMHVPICIPVAYPTNPPSGGDHWPVWANYTKYDFAIPREMYVHNQEHGGLVLAHNTTDGDRAAVVAALNKVFDGFTDPFCVKQGSTQARLIVTPDPQLTTPIAIGGWGVTYTATCIDEASLNDFIVANSGHGTEAVCADGQDPALIQVGCLSGTTSTGAGSGGGGAGGGGGGAGGG